MTYRIAGQRITAPDAGGHGLDMSNGQDWLVEDCIIDLSAYPLGQLDEAVGITWGSSATFRRCIFVAQANWYCAAPVTWRPCPKKAARPSDLSIASWRTLAGAPRKSSPACGLFFRSA